MNECEVDWWEAEGRRVPESFEAFMAELQLPTWFRFKGRDRSRCRIWTTLLHGNEPSGARAVHAYLLEGRVPAVDLVCLIASVHAAKTEPAFTHRFLPGQLDLNRCFRPPFSGQAGILARHVLETLYYIQPEALVDAHNTSGAGPRYSVANGEGPLVRRLAGFMTDTLVVSDLHLGALTEATAALCPSITVEWGGGSDPRADAAAIEGLGRFAEIDYMRKLPAKNLTVLARPARLELRAGAEVAYSREPASDADVTLHPDLDRYNFSTLPAGRAIGWTRSGSLDALCAVDGHGSAAAGDFLSVEDGMLVSRCGFRPLMITTNPEIAAADCLFYAVRDEDAYIRSTAVDPVS